jgi:3'-phosphoadenosine 5'-phosphosulfate (PAPS) 3'-phosphatase
MILKKSDLDALCKVAKDAAITAGRYIQSQFDQHYVKQSKVGGDSLASQVVSEVDFKAQEIILDQLQHTIQQYDLGLLTEESVDDQSRAVKDYFWCIDPMDGTLPFTERRTGYAVSIALVTKTGDSVVAAVYIPDLEVCYSSIKDQGVELNNKPYTRDVTPQGEVIDVYWDSSFKSEPYYEYLVKELTGHAQSMNWVIRFHYDYGGVRNAIGVMQSDYSCYFKFPKKAKGCGSIWDYAATSLFFKELGLGVTDASGNTLDLNKANTTFMNEVGILYATDQDLTQFILGLGEKVQNGVNKG